MGDRVLVVDDSRLCRLATQTVLEGLGYQVDALSDGRGAAEAAATVDFVAILMDCQMPNIDGFQATAEIRRCEAGVHGVHTPIIGLSSRDMRGDEEMAIANGMDAYITKPVNVNKLRAALARIAALNGPPARA